jgi:hypothetical protein
MDLTKKDHPANLILKLKTVARFHKFYLQGFHFAIESDDVLREALADIEGLERVLVGSGYLTESEVMARHNAFINLSTSQPREKGV